MDKVILSDEDLKELQELAEDLEKWLPEELKKECAK